MNAVLLALWLTVCVEGSQFAEYAIDIFHKILKKNKLLLKPLCKDPTSAKKKREIEKFKFKGLQVFYDGSGHTDPHLGGAGYAIFKDRKEILIGAETISFGTNNVGEFKDYLLRLKSARGLGSHIQIVGDCMILTKAAPKNCNISNHELNLLLIKIRATTKKKKKKNRRFKIQLSEFPIFCCSVYPCGWLPQKILTSSPSVKEGEGFPARNTWSRQADSESFAQVVKKSERKKRPLKTKEGFPASKGISDMLHKIDWNNIRLYQDLVTCLNPKTVVGAKSRPTKLVESLDFRPELPNFNKVIKVIENMTSLKGKIFVNIKQGHFVISALENMDATSVEKEILNKSNELAKRLKKSFIWRNNKDTKLWGLKIRVSFKAEGEEWIWNLFTGPNSLPRYNLKKVVQIVQNCIVLFYIQISINLVHFITHTKEWLRISTTQAYVSVWTPARSFDTVVKCPTCQINHPACLDYLFEILQKKDLSEVGNIVRTEMYSINTHNPKEVKIRKQAVRNCVQFNFVPLEGVSPSCTPLGNAGESTVVGPERTDQFSPKPHASSKPFVGLSPISVKKDGLNLPVCKFGDQGLVFCLLNLISAEPTPLKGPLKGLPPVKKSHEAIPNNFKVPSSSTKGSTVQRSSSVGPVKRDASTLIKTSPFSPIRIKSTSKIKTISGSVGVKPASNTEVVPFSAFSVL